MKEKNIREKKTTLLKKYLLDKKVLVMPGVYDAITAKICERAGFRALQCTGYGIAASVLGVPDIGILSQEDMLHQTRNIANAVDVPVMADGDTGFGDEISTYYTVKRFEQAGCAGINLEDQVFPKRCGHMDGKQVIPMDEMIVKVRAAAAAKEDADFIINARTDAIAVYGVDEAIKRGNAYLRAGADLIFVEAPHKKEDVERVVKSIEGPVSINMCDGGKTPYISFEELESWGVARISVPTAAVFAAAAGVKKAMELLMEDRRNPSAAHPELVMQFSEFTDLVGLGKINALREELNDEA